MNGKIGRCKAPFSFRRFFHDEKRAKKGKAHQIKLMGCSRAAALLRRHSAIDPPTPRPDSAYILAFFFFFFLR